MGKTKAMQVLNALSWKPSLNLRKHPLIPIGEQSYLFSYWRIRHYPSLAQAWLNEYTRTGSKCNIAGDVRGEIFEIYLEEMANKILGPGRVKRRELCCNTDIDLAVNAGSVGLVVQSKGGMIEFPTTVKDIEWMYIDPQQAEGRFNDNVKYARKWDQVVDCVRQSESVKQQLNLQFCSEIRPIIVYSKVQPINIEGYRIKCSYEIETEAHSISSFRMLLEELGGKFTQGD